MDLHRYCFLFLCLLFVGCETNPVLPQETLYFATQRVGFSVVVIGDLAYVLGGFYHANQNNGDAIGVIDVFSASNGTHLGAMNTSLPTPRGWMAVVTWNESFIVTIGGSEAFQNGQPLKTVEALHILTPFEGEWYNMNLTVPRLNATATSTSNGVVVALGASLEMQGFIELIDFDSQTTGVEWELPTSKVQDCNGTVGTLDDSRVILFCTGVNANSFLLTLPLSSWTLFPSPLQDWNSQFITQLDFIESLFQAENFAGASVFFTLQNGTISINPCLQLLECSGTLIYTPLQWICVTTLPTSIPSQNSTPQWNGMGGNPQNTQQSQQSSSCYPAFVFAGAPTLNWRYQFSNAEQIGYGSIAIGWNGEIYVVTEQKDDCWTLNAMNGTNGALQWEWNSCPPSEPNVENAWQQTPGIGSDGVLYSGLTTFQAFNANNGSILWNIGEKAAWFSSPVFGPNGFVYVWSAAHFGILSAFNSSGELVWTFSSGNLDQSSPAIGPDGTVYVTPYGNYLYALDGLSGEIKWSFFSSAGVLVTSSPTVAEDGTVISLFVDGLYAIDGQTGKKLWSYQMSPNGGSPSIGKDAVYLFGMAFDVKTGQQIWDRPIFVESPPAIGRDGSVYYTYQESYETGKQGVVLMVVDGQTGSVLWNLTTVKENALLQSPSLGGDGTIFFSSCPFSGMCDIYAYSSPLRNWWSVSY